MKLNIKQRYSEALNHIQFPAFIYYYETNRILSMNKQAIKILGDNIKNIKDVTLNHIRPKFGKELLDNGSIILYNQEVHTLGGYKLVDIEVNVITIDDKHMCVVFLEYSYKQNFNSNLNFEIPRLYWKNKEQIFVGMNESFRRDFNITMTQKECREQRLSNADLLEKQEELLADVEELRVLKGKESIYDTFQLIKAKTDMFTVSNRMPLFNKNGTVVGLIGCYQLVVEKEVYKQQFYKALGETYYLYEEQIRRQNLLSELLRISQLDIDYRMVLDGIRTTSQPLTHTDRMYLFRYSPRGEQAECIYASDEDILRTELENLLVPKQAGGMLKRIQKEGLAYIHQGDEEGRYDGILSQANLQTFLVLKIKMKGKWQGAAFFSGTGLKYFEPGQIDLLQEIVQYIQIVLDKWPNIEKLEE